METIKRVENMENMKKKIKNINRIKKTMKIKKHLCRNDNLSKSSMKINQLLNKCRTHRLKIMTPAQSRMTQLNQSNWFLNK